MSGRSNGYERLDRADMESLQVPLPPHDYAGLGNQTRGAGLDQHTDVTGDDRAQVSTEIHYL